MNSKFQWKIASTIRNRTRQHSAETRRKTSIYTCKVQTSAKVVKTLNISKNKEILLWPCQLVVARKINYFRLMSAIFVESGSSSANVPWNSMENNIIIICCNAFTRTLLLANNKHVFLWNNFVSIGCNKNKSNQTNGVLCLVNFALRSCRCACIWSRRIVLRLLQCARKK